MRHHTYLPITLSTMMAQLAVLAYVARGIGAAVTVIGTVSVAYFGETFYHDVIKRNNR